jgi:nucleotide-binding universal stress UspA family protein
MSGVILARIDHPQSAIATLAAAQTLARLMGSARINVLAIRVPPESTIMPTEEVLTPHQIADIRAREHARLDALYGVFRTWAAAARHPGVTIEWVNIEGLADTVIGEWGRRSDFVVLDRPAQHNHRRDRLIMHAVLFETDRPVLAVPPGPPSGFGERVAIAWRDDKRTERSVLAALRLLPQAKAVHVLAGARAGAPPPRLPPILIEHGIEAELHVMPVGAGVFGEMLLRTAHEVGADLLVMGAYTHSAWRDLLLGGVTRYMLAHADLPVLMRH